MRKKSWFIFKYKLNAKEKPTKCKKLDIKQLKKYDLIYNNLKIIIITEKEKKRLSECAQV